MVALKEDVSLHDDSIPTGDVPDSLVAAPHDPLQRRVPHRFPEWVRELNNRVRRTVAAGHPSRALEILDRYHSQSPVLVNARGVVLLRLERYDESVDELMALVRGAAKKKSETPPDALRTIRRNAATALLMAERFSDCEEMLDVVDDEANQRVAEMRLVLRTLNAEPLWKRILIRLGLHSRRAAASELSFTLGELL